MKAVCSAIADVQTGQPHLPLLVLGDFNARHPMWHDTRPRNDCNGGDTALAEWIDEADLHVHNPPDTPTRVTVRRESDGRKVYTSTVIDLVLSLPMDLVSDITQRHSHLYNNNDHIPFTLELALHDRSAPLNPLLSSRPRIKWDTDREPLRWQRALPAAMERHIAPLRPLLNSLLPQRDNNSGEHEHNQPVGSEPHTQLDMAYEQLEKAITMACADTVGVKHVEVGRNKKVPWWTRDVDRAFRARNNAFNRLAADKASEFKRTVAIAARRRWKATVRHAKRQAQQQLATLAMDPDSKLRYSTLRRYQKSLFSPLTGIKDDTGAMPASHTQSLDNLCRAFIRSSIPPPLIAADPADAYDRQEAASCDDSSDRWRFTADEVCAQTKRRTCKTSAGPDAILPLFLRYGGKPLWAALATVYNYSWRYTVTPQAWREANVTALYKGKGGRSEPLSYRPISVTSGIIRTLEHIVHDRLIPIVAPHLADTQFGFRTHRSTTDAILQLLTSLQYLCGVTNRVSTKQQQSSNRRQPEPDAPAGPQQARRQRTYTGEHRKLRCAALFLDIKKAFDRVDHGILLARLYHVGVRGTAWRWIHAFLTKRRMRCVDSQQESGWQEVQHGVPQGCVLSPLLFLVFINNVVKAISTSNDCRLVVPTFYADDGVLGPHLWRSRSMLSSLGGQVNRFEQQYGRQLKAAAAHLDRWCDTSRMHFGEDKTQIVVFNRGTTTDNTHYAGIRLCGFEVAVTDSYEYLGLLLTSDLTWTRHAERKCVIARAAATRVTNIALNAQPVQPAIIRELVRACVVPAFDYGVELWGTGLPQDTIRSFQAAVARPLRAALGLPSTAHQQSVLWGYGIPAFVAHVQHKQLLHLRRVSHLLRTDVNHPTARLYSDTRTRLIDEHHRMLDVQTTLPVPVYFLTAVLPFTHPPPQSTQPPPPGTAVPLHIAYSLPSPPTLDGSLPLSSPTTWQRRVELARDWSSAGPGIARAPLRHRRTLDATWAQLEAIHTPAPDVRRQANDRIRRIRRAAADSEWVESHMPMDEVERDLLSATERNRRTTAPIRHCKHDDINNADTDALPLRFLRRRYATHVQHSDLVRRARLLFNRSFTATIRQRFATDPAAASASTACTHVLCAAGPAPVEESIEHLLLDCPRYASARSTLHRTLRAHQLHVNLCTILNPPDRGRRRYLALYDATTAYISAIDSNRQQNGLPRLDANLSNMIAPA